MCVTDLQVIRAMAGERAKNRRRWRVLLAIRAQTAIRGRCLLAAALIALLVLAAAGCGGGGSSSTSTSTGATGASGATGIQRESTSAQSQHPGGPTPQRHEGRNIPDTISLVLAPKGPGFPKGCGPLVTPRYVEAAYGSVSGCLQAVKSGGVASAVEVHGIYVNQSAGTAKAYATPTGGPNDGEKLTVELVQERGVWKVDSIKSNAPVGP
jgi:hypothetical protein